MPFCPIRFPGVARCLVVVLAALVTVSAGPRVASAQVPTSPACDALAGYKAPDVTVVSATVVAPGAFVPTPPASGAQAGAAALFKGLPAFCRVVATLTPTPASSIGMEVWMPLSGWNGRFQAVGNGGWTGSISYPAMSRALARGYATASTDTGHRGDSGAFALGQPEKLIDFGWRAVHLTAVQSKAFITAYFGNGPRYSYWNGCSSGGKQGLKEAQRFPGDFDGIIAGAPANNWVNQKVAHIVVQQVVNRTADTRIPASKYPVLHAAVMQACDRLDGVADGVLEDPRTCRFDPSVLACTGADAPACLTASQVETARVLYAPVTVPRTGEFVFPGMVPGAEKSWDVQAGPEPRQTQIDLLKYVVFNDPNWDYKTFDLESGLARALKTDAEGAQSAATDPNLAPFFGRGGKLLLYHGWADPNIMAMNTINYYNSVRTALGDTRAVDESMRLFMVPGMGHCNGGDGPNNFDMLTALEQWVEQGRIPERIVASRVVGDVVTRTRPLCAFPRVARFNGTGSTDAEANFVCAIP